MLFIRVNDASSFEASPNESLAGFCTRVAPLLGLEHAANEVWLASTPDGSIYSDRPFRDARPLRAFVDGAAPHALLLVKPAVCRHGAPDLPTRGFPCGWC
jgi:hypothetical protein